MPEEVQPARHRNRVETPEFGAISEWTLRGDTEVLSREERARRVERTLAGLYRWYVARSQSTRNWNPDTNFSWSRCRRDHDEQLHVVIEGFYAVEQFVPDYVHTFLRVIRTSYGRSHFHIRWGAEEEKHAALWRNAVLSMGRRNNRWLDDYTGQLRQSTYELPWEDPLRMLFYTVLQERATQVTYLNVGLAVSGGSGNSEQRSWTDPVLAEACQRISTDEAAHYHFFLEAARLYLYYFPVEAVQALVDVLRHFVMPANDIIPEYSRFADALNAAGFFGPRPYYRDVLKPVLAVLGVNGLRAVEKGLRHSREVPAHDGGILHSRIFETIDRHHVERCVRTLDRRIDAFSRTHGLEHTF